MTGDGASVRRVKTRQQSVRKTASGGSRPALQTGLRAEPVLSEVCEFIVDCLHATAPIQEAGYPLVRTPNIGRGRLQLDGVHRVSQATYDQWTRRATPVENDLVLAREAPAGNVAIVRAGQEICLGQRTVHLRPNPALIDPEFLCYYLLTPKMQGELLAGETGATSKHVNMADIRKLRLGKLPSLADQRWAASTISSYDTLIENNRRRVQLLEESAHLLYREWFVRLRFPGHERAQIHDGVPTGWRHVTAADILHIDPSETLTKGIDRSFVPMAALSESGMTVDISKCERRTQPSGAKFRNGDVLFARITPCLENGKTAFVNFLQEGEVAVGSTEFIVLRGNSVSPEFSYCLARTHELREHAKHSMIGSSGRQRVQASAFKKYWLALPPQPLLDEFTSIVEPLFKQVRSLVSTNNRLLKARNLLLPKLMSGEMQI